MKSRSESTDTVGGPMKYREELDDRIAYLASLVKNISDALISTDMDFNILEWNAAAESIYGWTAAEATGHPLQEFIQSEYTDATTRADAIRAVSEQGYWKGEVTQKRKDGTPVPIMASVSWVKSPSGLPIGYVAINRDITERKSAEKKLIQMKRLYATLSQVSQSIVRIQKPDELYQSVCDLAVQFGEFSLAWVGILDEATGEIRPVAARGLDITHWPFPIVNIRQGDYMYGLVAEAVRTSKVMTSEDMQANDRSPSMHAQYKQLGYHSSAAIPFRLRDKPIGMMSLVSPEAGFFIAPDEISLLEEIGLDISFALDTMETKADQRRTEDALQIENERFQRFVESNIVGIVIANASGKIISANDYYLKLLGVSRRDFEEGIVDWRKFTPPEWLAADEQAIRELNERGICKPYEKEYVRIDDTRVSVYIADAMMPGPDQQIAAFVLDITERKKTEEALAASQRLLQSIIDNSTTLIYALDLEGRFLLLNCTLENLLGVPSKSLIGKTREAILPPEIAEQHLANDRQVIASQFPITFEEENEEADGKHFYLSVKFPLLDGQGNMYGIGGISTHITERKLAEQTLRESESSLKISQAVAHVGHWTWDTRTNTVYWSDEMKRIFGIVPEDFGGNLDQVIQNAIHPDDRQRVLAMNEAVIKKGQPQSTEYRIMRKDGSVRHIWAEPGKRVEDESGNIIQLSGIVQDITERRQAENLIQSQLQRLNSLREIDQAISSSFELDFTLDVVLQQILSHLSVDAAAILLVNPDEQTIEYAASRGFHSNVLHHTQLKLDGGYAGRAVRERQTIHIPDIITAGGKLAEAMQLADEDFVDYHATPLIVKDEIKGVLEIYHRSALSPDPEWLDFLEVLAGQAAIAIDNAQLFEDLQRANAELEQRVAKRTEELEHTNIELEHANRTKDEFLAAMSHELRTPLNSILGLSETLLEQKRDSLSEHQQRSINVIASSGQHLLELINDILDLSKIGAGKMDYYPETFEVDEFCRTSLAFVKEQANRKSISILFQKEPHLTHVHADPRRLKQILVNLLTNAVKFTPEHGQVTLKVREDSEKERIQFSVIDTGIGIQQQDLQKLFKPFVQVDSRLNRQFEGTGLGLALVQKLTDLHGGSVAVESEVGKGSRFTINLPLAKDRMPSQVFFNTDGGLLARSQSNATSPSPDEPSNRKVILLAEDNLSNILTVGEYLESHGYQIVVAHNGWEAIEKARETNPDIILMDIQMPSLDGLEAIRKLRTASQFTSTPIIALTALAMRGDRERCLQAGANEYLSKPVSLKLLLKTILGFLDIG